MPGVDPERDFVAVVEETAGSGPAGCWVAVEILAGAFWGPAEASHGVPDLELTATEEDLGFRLPATLREGYRRFGRLPLLSTQDRLLEPQQLRPRGDDQLVFRVENQACAWWSCSVNEGDDPPVHLWRDDTRSQVDAGTVSQFFVHMALSEIVLGARHVTDWGLDDRIEPPESLLRPLPVAPFAWWPGADVSPRRFFGGVGLVVAVDPTPWLWAAATSGQKLDQVKAVMSNL